LASQVISDDSEIVNQLPNSLQKSFIEPKERMVPGSFPEMVKENVMIS
jgi:hypothetical protein